MAMQKQNSKQREEEIQVVRVNRARVRVALLGTTPLIMNKLSEKAKRELLMPSPKKSRTDKATTLKHDPYEEFRSSAHLSQDDESPTLLLMPGAAFKGALCNAAKDLPGSATKAAIGRLCGVEEEYVPIYGVPKMLMSIVRMADMARTPDVRTRLIVPEWAAVVTLSFVTPILKEAAVINLFAGAGIVQGAGDWRVEKGKGNFGCWELVEFSDARFEAVMQRARGQQVGALQTPEPYDAESAELLTWFSGEAKRREFKTKEAI